MTRLRLLNVILILALAGLACSLGSTGNTLPATDTPRPTAVRQPTDEAPTDESPTDEPTEEAPTDEPVVRPTSTPSGSKCTTFKATNTEVAWVTLDADNNVDQQVNSYPPDTTTITPLFEYNCVPRPVEIVTVFSLNGEQVFSDKETIKATKTSGLYGYPLGTTDGSALDDGTWGVEFYNNKTLVASGAVEVGVTDNNTNTNGNDNQSTSKTVTVEGTVTDKASGTPVEGAIVLFLNPGTKVQAFIDGGYKDADVFTGAKTDSKGAFTLPVPVERNVGYSLVIVADGWKPVAADDFIIDDSQPDPVSLDVQLTK
jgi:carboxypeptidase family protein